MNIGYFNSRGINPVENWFSLEIEELQKLGHEVRIFWLKGNQPTKKDIEWMDIAHFHFAHVADYYKKMGVPFIISGHAHDIYRDSGQTLLRASKHPMCKAVSFQCWYHKRLLREWGIEKPLFYLPMACRTELFKRNKFNYNRIIAGGRLIPKKGLNQIVGKIPNLTIFGEGPLRKELEEQAHSWSKTSTTKFTGWLDGNQMKELMEDSWLFLNPSIITPDGDREGIPNTLKEAACMRLQILSSDVGGISELENVILLNDWSPEDISKALDLIPRQENWKGEQEVRNIYSPESCVGRLLKAIGENAEII